MIPGAPGDPLAPDGPVSPFSPRGPWAPGAPSFPSLPCQTKVQQEEWSKLTSSTKDTLIFQIPQIRTKVSFGDRSFYVCTP